MCPSNIKRIILLRVKHIKSEALNHKATHHSLEHSGEQSKELPFKYQETHFKVRNTYLQSLTSKPGRMAKEQSDEQTKE